MDKRAKYELKFIRKTIRFTPEEYQQIEEQRQKTNISFSEYVRLSASKQKIKSTYDNNFIYELNKIGINLNQIAKAVNEASGKEKIKALYTLVEIEKQLKDLKNGS